MAVFSGPEIPNNGLVLHIDIANPKIGLKNYAAGNFTGNVNIPTTTVTDTLPDGTTGTVYEHTAILQGDTNRTGTLVLSNSLERGKTYTLSFYIKNINCTGFYGNVFNSSLGRVILSFGSYTNSVNTSGWSRVTRTFTIPNEGPALHSLHIQYFRDGGTGTWRAVWPQVEEGTVATTYAPRFSNPKLLSNINTSLSLISGTNYVGNSIFFDGTNDYAIIPSFNVSNIANNFTFSVWVYLFTLPTANPRFLHFSTNTDNIWNLAAYGGGDPANWSWFWIERKKAGTFYGSAGTALKYVTNTWYNVTGTFNDSDNTAALFVNGVQISTMTGIGGGSPATNNDLYVGSTQMNGLLSDIKIYNRVLSATEVKQNFEATRSRYGI